MSNRTSITVPAMPAAIRKQRYDGHSFNACEETTRCYHHSHSMKECKECGAITDYHSPSCQTGADSYELRQSEKL